MKSLCLIALIPAYQWVAALAGWPSLPEWAWIPLTGFLILILLLYTVGKKAMLLEEPKLSLGEIFKQSQRTPHGGTITTVSIAITNNAASVAKGVEVVLASLQTRTHLLEIETPLYADGCGESLRVDLNGLDSKRYRIGRHIFDHRKHASFDFYRRKQDDLDIQVSGTNYISLKISSETSPMQTMRFIVDVAEDGNLTFEMKGKEENVTRKAPKSRRSPKVKTA